MKLKKNKKMISIINSTVKMIFYINRNSSTDLHLTQVKMVMRYLFLIEKYWASTNEKLSFLCVWLPVYTEFLNFGTLLWKVISSIIPHCFSIIVPLMQLSP